MKQDGNLCGLGKLSITNAATTHPPCFPLYLKTEKSKHTNCLTAYLQRKTLVNLIALLLCRHGVWTQEEVGACLELLHLGVPPFCLWSPPADQAGQQEAGFASLMLRGRSDARAQHAAWVWGSAAGRNLWELQAFGSPALTR